MIQNLPAQFKCAFAPSRCQENSEAASGPGIERNQADAMAAWIPYAGQLLLPQVGHAALLQDPKFLNFAVEYFLDMAYNGVVPYY